MGDKRPPNQNTKKKLVAHVTSSAWRTSWYRPECMKAKRFVSTQRSAQNPDELLPRNAALAPTSKSPNSSQNLRVETIMRNQVDDSTLILFRI